MPELPEVETIVKSLNQQVKNRQIVDLWTDWPKYFKLPKGEKEFRKHVIGKKITGVERRGKNILFQLSDNHLLLVHQKISGHFLVGQFEKNEKKADVPENWLKEKWRPKEKGGPLWDNRNRFLRLIFFLDNGQMLALSDLRRFAKVLCGPKEVILNLPELANLGQDALSLSLKEFTLLFENKKGFLKQALMDQNFIAGIGNIYADEILWLAKIHPKKRVEDLTAAEIKTLYLAMRKILNKALKLQGSSIDDYRLPTGQPGRYHLARYVYQRENQPCFRCQTLIKRIKLGGRSAHFCPKCQK